jgi:hypothetical protein
MTRWSPAQVCVWIATGDAQRAEGLQRYCTIFEAGFTLFSGGLTSRQSRALDAGISKIPIGKKTLDGIALRRSVWDARDKLLDALRDNSLSALGRAGGIGDMVQIKSELWVGLTLHDEPGDGPGKGVVARPQDGLNFSATWFDEISVAVDDVLRVWPRTTMRPPSKPKRDHAFDDFVKQNPGATRMRAEEELRKVGMSRQEIRDRWKELPKAHQRRPGRPKK